jgi:hypothetical protein
VRISIRCAQIPKTQSPFGTSAASASVPHRALFPPAFWFPVKYIPTPHSVCLSVKLSLLSWPFAFQTIGARTREPMPVIHAAAQYSPRPAHVFTSACARWPGLASKVEALRVVSESPPAAKKPSLSQRMTRSSPPDGWKRRQT